MTLDAGKDIMERRDFLKACLALVAGMVAWRWRGLVDAPPENPGKEALFYRRDDSLAG